MSDSLAVLQRLFHRQCRSLAQYVGESWPWTHRKDAAAQELVRSIMADEMRWAERLAELIDQRGGIPLAGNYPDAFTQANLHYVALDFLLGRLAESIGDELVSLRADAAAVQDPDVRSLIEQMIERKQGQVEALRKLGQSFTQSAGAASTAGATA